MTEQPKLIPLDVNVDDRGSLFEAFHHFDLPEQLQPFRGQVYVVRSPARGTIRGFHRHERLWDFFTVLQGRARVVLVEAVSDGASRGGYMATSVKPFTLCQEKPARLVVPPGWFHGWVSLTDDTVLLSIGSEVYNREHPDEERIPADTFYDVWTVKPK